MTRPAAVGACLAAALVVFSCGAGPREEAQTVESSPSEAAGAPAEEARHTNRLAGESSPYLLLHVHNPVDWYPWGEEALAKAREEDKPIFLSVGYSTCYWCHVMEREVFSDPEIASLMNRWFVNVKVDREERPDLDEIYMTATQLLTRGGGWPNSVFLTPELEPFYAGTYFPPEDRHGRPGFPTVLRGIHEAWTERRPEVEAAADRLAGAMGQVLAARGEASSEVPSPRQAEEVVRRVRQSYDPTWGGFGPAPKFPSPGKLLLLWEAGEPSGEAVNPERGMVLDTLRKMGRGGIYDHAGGGFHRYSTDERWLVPHFEKMLYDNAHLAEILATAWRESRDPELARLARGTLDFVLRELTLPGGGFKSAIDAETDAEEGAYYVWTAEELREVLGEEGFDLLAPIYGFDGEPSFEGGRYILHLTAPLAEHADRLEVSREALLQRIEPFLGRLLEARKRREMPLVDDKVLTDWNGMMIAGMARAGAILDEPRYLEAATRAAVFLLEELDPDEDNLLHAWRGGEAKIDAFLDDYAYFVRGLLALHEVTAEDRWLSEAVRLADELEERLAAPGGGYYLTAPDPELLFQPLTVTGGAIPSGNAVAVHDLIALAEATGEARFLERAERSLRVFATHLERFPEAVPMLAAAVVRLPREAVEATGEDRPAPVAADAGGQGPAGSASPDALEALARNVVEARARASGVAGPWRTLEVHLSLEEGWHVNANPASEEFLIPTQVEGEVRGVRYPEGESFRFPYAETPLQVYQGEVTLRGEVAAGAEEVLVTYQACDDRRCLPPVTEALPLGGENQECTPEGEGANRTEVAVPPYSLDGGHAMSCRQPPREAPPILIEYRDLVRCTARIDGVFDWQGWEEVGGEDGPEVLFVHHGRLGCYRRARGDGATHLGCAGMPFPFGDFLVTLDTAIREDGGGHRIESELQLYFFALRDDRRRDLWGGRIELAAAPDGSLSGLEVGAMAGVLNGTALLRRLARAHDCRADSTCWQVALGTTVVDVAVAR